MWLLNLVTKLFGGETNSPENYNESDTDPSESDTMGDSDDPGSYGLEMLTVDEYTDAFKQLYFDLRGKIASQEEIRNFEIACRFAMQEADELEQAIYYMAEAMHATSDSEDVEVPEYVVKFGKALIVEYITGTLRIIQTDVIDAAEEEDDE